jgi:hypothetical protein
MFISKIFIQSLNLSARQLLLSHSIRYSARQSFTPLLTTSLASTHTTTQLATSLRHSATQILKSERYLLAPTSPVELPLNHSVSYWLKHWATQSVSHSFSDTRSNGQSHTTRSARYSLNQTHTQPLNRSLVYCLSQPVSQPLSHFLLSAYSVTH